MKTSTIALEGGNRIRIHHPKESIQTRFVGRRRELSLLLRALPIDPKPAGQFVVLSGEAGIGKTRILSEVADIAIDHGVKVLWSQLSEDPAVPPYFSWRMALRSYLHQANSDQLIADAGSGASEIATIVPELADALDVEPKHDESGSPAARFQLFDSVARFLQRASGRSPLLLLFDNLLAADRSSLALLEYFSFQIAGSPIAVICAIRDSDLTRKHPMRNALSTLSRSAGFSHIRLEGLPEEEVAELLQQHVGCRLPRTFIDEVQKRGDGNPLFVAEVAAMLLKRKPDEWAVSGGFNFAVPDSLRSVIADRIEDLPERTTVLLRIASVLGRSFELIDLAGLARRSIGSVQRALSAAEEFGIVSSDGRGEYSFTHAMFREVLYAESATIQRVALHRRAGELIEKRYGDQLREHLAALAYHFFEAAQSDQQQKAISYCVQAGDSASKQRAYSEAIGSFERALQVVEYLADDNDELRFELLHKIGLAQYQAAELNRSIEVLLKACVLAYRRNWWNQLAEVLFLFQLVCQESGYHHVSSVPLHEEVLNNLPADDQACRAKTLVSLSRAYRSVGDPELAASTYERGLKLARTTGDKHLILVCLRKGAWSVGRLPERIEEGLSVSREALSLATELNQREARLDALVDTAFQLSDVGAIAELEMTLSELRRLVTREQQMHFNNLVTGFQTSIAILRGDWKRAVQGAREGLRHLPLQGVNGLRGRFGFQMFAIHRAQGLLKSVHELADQIISEGFNQKFWLPGQILLHCELGQLPEARRAIRDLGDLSRLPRDDLFLVSLIFLADAVVAVRDKDRCRVIYELLCPYKGLNATLPGTLMLGTVSGYLGSLAAANGDLVEARSLFEESLIHNESMNARPALVRSKVELARLLLANEQESERVRARGLIEDARRDAVELNLRPLKQLADELGNRSVIGHLTDREVDVLRSIAAGLSNRHIADKLCISTSTVATHIRHIFRKTGVRNRTSAAEFGRRSGLLG